MSDNKYPGFMPEWLVAVAIIGGLLFFVTLLLVFTYILIEVITGEFPKGKDDEDGEVYGDFLPPESDQLAGKRVTAYTIYNSYRDQVARRRQKRIDDQNAETVEEARRDFE